MELTTLLFILRVASALLLLLFLGGIGLLIYRDMQLLGASLTFRQQAHGFLRVVSVGDEENEALPAIDHQFPLLSLTSIGRSAGNHIILPDSYASNQHALINLRGQQWWLEDLGSRNGTLLNNLPVEDATVLSPGDLITVGNIQFRLELSQAG